METILELIKNEQWEEALKLFLDINDKGNLDVEACIVGASIMEYYMQWDVMFSLIEYGLRKDPANYELYYLLGNYYSNTNIDQAYLSYENALYYCCKSGGDNIEDATSIEVMLNNLKESGNVKVRNVSFIILSFNNLDYTKICIKSIRNTCYEKCYEIVVVDNGSNDGSVEWLREQSDIILVENTENRGFPGGCNQGIEIANQGNDIFLLNNDTLLTVNSLFWLRMGVYDKEETGASGAVTNYAGNGQKIETGCDSVEEYIEFGARNNVPLHPAYEIKPYLIMFAMLIKRMVIDKTGLLDERFSPGNYEDNDYGLRMLCDGFKCILCHNSFIYHFGSRSFIKNPGGYNELLNRNGEKFKDKWGYYTEQLFGENIGINDIIKMIEG